MDFITNKLVSFGLETPMKRAVAGFVIGSLFDAVVQPSWAYTSDGVRRNSYYAEQVEGSQFTNPTYLPAGSSGMILAAVFGLFL